MYEVGQFTCYSYRLNLFYFPEQFCLVQAIALISRFTGKKLRNGGLIPDTGLEAVTMRRVLVFIRPEMKHMEMYFHTFYTPLLSGHEAKRTYYHYFKNVM